MLRRFSVNFALFSMLLDGLSTALGLLLAAVLRPLLNRFSFIQVINDSQIVPAFLFILFPVIWVIIFSSLSIYDGRKFLRAADELAALFLSTLIASISTAGILYFSYRQVSRALFLVFVAVTFLLCFFWRVLARVYFRTRQQSAATTRHLLIVGTGPLGQSVGKQIRRSLMENLTLIGFVEDGNRDENKTKSLGAVADLKSLIEKYQVTDVVIALPYSVY